MKVSVSLPVEDIEFLDAYARAHELRSRSAALQQAVRALRISGLGDAYAAAWAEWETGGDAAMWEQTAADGV